jgi:hypothetical protein
MAKSRWRGVPLPEFALQRQLRSASFLRAKVLTRTGAYIPVLAETGVLSALSHGERVPGRAEGAQANKRG